MKNKLLSALLGIGLVLFVLSFSIALPILCRPLFYVQIEKLSLPEQTGYSAEELREAYDELLDYLTLPGKPFGTGVFPHSEAGAAHFADCKVLILLDFGVLLFSILLISALTVLKKRKLFHPARPFGYPLAMSCGIGILAVFALLFSLVCINFTKAFYAFHHLFFAGKDNWNFDPDTDPIIYMLPHDFFAACGALIFAGVLLLCAGLILGSLLCREREKKHL